jgi:uncharacterized delta-60 repeat protein
MNTAPSFLNFVTTDFSGSDHWANSIAIGLDGKIIVAGSARVNNSGDRTTNFALARFSVNGELDTSFGINGKLTTDFDGNYDAADSIFIQPDGKILAAGYAKFGYGERYALVRYKTDGSLDPSFGTDGKTSTVAGVQSFAKSLSVLADGKILLAGSLNNDYPEFGVARYNANGSLDTNFGTKGIVTTDFTSTYDNASSMAVQVDGKIIIAGSAYNPTLQVSVFAIARYNSDGSIDTNFGNNGKLTTDFEGINEGGNSVIIQTDGKIVVAGSASNNFALARYNTDGSLDGSFDGDGKVTTDFGGSEGGNSVIIQTDGKIVVAGSTSNNFALARYNTDGSLDSSFDGDGKVTTKLGDYSYGSSATLQTDEKIVVAGSANNNFAVIRYNIDGSIDKSFMPSTTNLPGKPTFLEWGSSFSNVTTILSPTVFINDSELGGLGNYLGATLKLSRYGGASTEDQFSAKSGGTLTSLSPNSYLAVNGVTIGRVTSNDAGTLVLTFNANATQLLVNEAMQQIAYKNTSNAPPDTVQIDWTFNDGNTGAQGAGGALSTTGTTFVSIIATNDAPMTGYNLPDRTVTTGVPFIYTLPAGAFTDPDQEPLSYGVVAADGSGVPPWMRIDSTTGTLSGTPDQLDVGTINLLMTASDSSGSSANDFFVLSIGTSDTTAPTVSSFSPTDGAKAVLVGANIVVTFSEAIQRGTGNIVLKDAANNVVATYDAASNANLSISGSTLTINPTADLGYSTNYFVTFASGTIKDLAGNSYTDNSTFDFTTASLGKNVDLLVYNWKTHTLLNAVTVTSESHSGISNSQGTVSFFAVTENSLSLSASRNVPEVELIPTNAAVNLQDAIAILKMIVGLDVNGAGKPLSPYQSLAADFDLSGQVTLADAIGVLKHVVGLSAPEPTWHFVDESSTTVAGIMVAPLTPGQPPFMAVNTASSESPIQVGLVGYLRGDVDGSFAGVASADDLDATQPNYFQDLSARTGFNLSQFGVYV